MTRDEPVTYAYPRAPLAHTFTLNDLELGDRVARAMLREDDGWGFGTDTAHLFDIPHLGIISSTRRKPGDRTPYNPPVFQPAPKRWKSQREANGLFLAKG